MPLRPFLRVTATKKASDFDKILFFDAFIPVSDHSNGRKGIEFK
jgi:hypothetical protein